MTSFIKRAVETHSSSGYKQVSLEFRKARAEALEKAKIHERKERIHCPVLDAARNDRTYGKCPMHTTDQDGMDQFARAIKADPSRLAHIAYLSGVKRQIPYNFWTKTFDELQVNIGLVRSLKCDVHTNIIGSGVFNQDTFNRFVWNLFPDLKDTPIDLDFLMFPSSGADGLFITENNLEDIMAWNTKQSNSSALLLGPTISRFEIDFLLLGKLGQKIVQEGEEEEKVAKGSGSKEVQAISLCDFHDFYKYGVFPAPIEDNLVELGLAEEMCLAFTATQPSPSSTS